MLLLNLIQKILSDWISFFADRLLSNVKKTTCSMRLFFNISLIFLLCSACDFHQPNQKVLGTTTEHAMVSSAHPLASAVGVSVMQDGGNAIDAAIAVHFALAVVYPQAGNIGGGGFAVIRMHDGSSSALDFRETAPSLATKRMYLDENGDLNNKRWSTHGRMSSGVPGAVDGMFSLHKRFGSKSMESLIQPAIDLAKNGYELTFLGAKIINTTQEDFREHNDWPIPYLQGNLNLVLESAWTKLANGQWKGLGLVGSSLMGTTQTNSQSVFYSIADDIALQLHSESGTMQSTTFSSGKMVIAFSNKVVSVDSSESVRQIATASNDLEGVSFTSALATNDAVYIGTVDNGLFQQTASETRVVSPNGPLKNDIFDLTVLPNDELWIVHGAFQRNYNPYPLNSFGLSHLNGGAWQNIPYSQLLGAKSLVSVTANPNNHSQVFVAAMHQGILELNDGVATNLWDHTNSGLESIDPCRFIALVITYVI